MHSAGCTQAGQRPEARGSTSTIVARARRTTPRAATRAARPQTFPVKRSRRRLSPRRSDLTPESTIEALREAVRARLGVAADTKGRQERIEAKLHEKERARGQIRAGLRSGALTADEVEADLKVLRKSSRNCKRS